MPVLIIFYVSSCFCTSLTHLWGLKFYLLHLVSLACCTHNLNVLLSFHVLCIGPAFLGLHVCVLYITAETVVGHYIRTEMYLYVSPKYSYFMFDAFIIITYVYLFDNPSGLAV